MNTHNRGIRMQAIAGAILGFGILAMVSLESSNLLSVPFPGFLLWKNGMLVAFHLDSWTGAEAGLPLNGGRVIEVDGEPIESGLDVRDLVANEPVGRMFDYTVELHDGSRHEVLAPSMRLGRLDYLATFGVYLLNGVSFLLAALVAFALRPDLLAARALAVSSGFMGLLLALSIDFMTRYRAVPVVQMIEALTPVAILNFALVFPEERLSVRRRRLLIGGLAAVFAGLGLANVLLFERAPWTARSLSVVMYAAISVAGLATIVGQGEALLQGSSTRARLQASIVFFGTLVAFALPAVAVLAFVTLGWNVSFTWIAVLLPVFPFSVLYAVVRHNLLEAERFVRLTVGYALAATTVTVGYALSLLTLEQLLGSGAGPVLSFAVLLVMATGFEPVRRRGHQLLDRLFYRSVPNPGLILEQLGGDLAGIASESEAAHQVAATIQEALQVAWCKVDISEPRLPDRTQRAEVSEPLLYRAERLGEIRCGAKLSGAPFSLAERDLLKGIAAQTALAVRNARSFEELRLSQESLARHERLAAIGELAGSVAHGVRNPLAGIRSTAQIAFEKSQDADQSELLMSILDGAERLDQRIRTLLDFSRPFVPNIEEVAISDLFQSVQEAFVRTAERVGASIEARCEPPDLTARVDRDYLEEVLLELVGNGLRVLSNGGRIHLEASRGPAGITLRVRDTGPGVPEAVRDRIFELFFSTRVEGSGMGLASVKKIVERHGGQVTLETAGPEGCCFRIDLP